MAQIGAMKSRYPSFKVEKLGDGHLLFTGSIQPKEYMREYTVSIEYRGAAEPHVKVISPALVEEPPHYYHISGRLCLFKPANFNWKESTIVANHIVSWTSAWLYFYEIWLEKGVWYGPEAPHENNKQEI
ncbi:MAG: hypothetical protein JWP12_2470 [Bacteroidetes bacterium]|nr:hypothetical protein [Bacteroidota bacterium]